MGMRGILNLSSKTKIATYLASVVSKREMSIRNMMSSLIEQKRVYLKLSLAVLDDSSLPWSSPKDEQHPISIPLPIVG